MRRNESTSQLQSKKGNGGSTPSSPSHLSLGQSRTDSMSTLESLINGMSGPSSPSLSHSGSTPQLTMQRPGDKTQCEYCGVSYMTMNAMRTLQAKVKDQEEKLSQLKETTGENTRMKETLANIRKNHRKEVTKRDEECQRWVTRCSTVEIELEQFKKDLKESHQKNSDWAQKYAIASEDFKQQEELISHLRSQLQTEGDLEAENKILINKNKNLEDNLQKLLQEIKSLRTPSTSQIVKTPTDNSVNETALKSKIMELTERCNRLTAENALYQEELLTILQNQEQQTHLPLASGDSNNKPQKMPSVVSVEVHDLKRENTILHSRLQSLSEEHSNCQDMHAFLRESIEKLKTDNVKLVEEMNGVKVKYEESLLKLQNFQVVISGYQAERNRFMSSYKDQQNKLEQLAAQNRAFHKSCDPKLIEQLKQTVKSLEKQIQQMQQDSEKQQIDFESKLKQVQREVIMEKEKLDSCLTHGLTERENVEKRWQERWTRHHSKLTGQLEILKTNYEGSLKCAKEREEALQREIHHLQEKMAKHQKSMEDYKLRMKDELLQWKIKYEELEDELQNTVKGKVDVEVMFQEKSQQLEELHEALRQGCEERHDLQRRTEELERSIQECITCSDLNNSSVLNFHVENVALSAQDSGSLSVVETSNESTDADASVWKQSQNYVPPPTKKQSKNDESSSGSLRQRPSSPFPLLGGKNGPQTFTVGSGKKGGNLKEKTSSSKSLSSKSSGGVVFSVAPPPNPRKGRH